MVHVFNFCPWEISLIFLFLDFFLYKSRYCRVSQYQRSTFPRFFIVLLYGIVVCVVSVGAIWIFFLVLTCLSECFALCPPSVTGQLLVFELRGDSCLGGLSINYNIKIYTRWFIWKILNGYITNRLIKFTNYWRVIFYSVSVKPSL